MHPSHLDDITCVVIDEADIMLSGPSSDPIMNYLVPKLRMRMLAAPAQVLLIFYQGTQSVHPVYNTPSNMCMRGSVCR